MSLVAVTDHEGVWVLAVDRAPVNAIDLSVVRAVHDAAARAVESTFVDELCAPAELLATARARAAAALASYATVKRQFKADALARIRRIVEEDADPMLERWI